MGGHAAGDVASRLGVDTVLKQYYQANDAPGEHLAGAIRTANQCIYQTARENPDLEGMGCTIVAGAFLRDQVIVAHVGDSRCYRARAARLKLLTRDHLYVTESLGLSAAEARIHPMRHALSRALGAAPEVDPEIQAFSWQPEDRYLFCSDGLSNTIEETELLLALMKDTPQEAVAYLLHQAENHSAADNTTAIVVHLDNNAIK
jgi:protein phosphatase